MKTKLVHIACLLFISSLLLGNNIEVRFASQPFPSTDRIAVSVEVRNTTNSEVVLADQNYRLYYDADDLEFDEANSVSKLPSNTYSEIDLYEHIAELKSLTSNGEMGFINFSINLLDLVNGGVELPTHTEWLSVATLYFDVTNHNIDNSHLVWSRQGVTDEYASAFVHITEWVAPRTVESLNIDEYHDASLSDLNSYYDMVNVRIGPNPASDYISIDLSEPASSDMTILITDMTGKHIKQNYIREGESYRTIDISDLSSSSYIMDIYNQDNQVIYSDKIVVTLL